MEGFLGPDGRRDRFCHSFDRDWHCRAGAGGGRSDHRCLCPARSCRHDLPAPVQPAADGVAHAPQPHRPRAHRHQLLGRGRRGQRARHPPPREHRQGRHRLRHRGRHDARCLERPADGDLPRRRRRQLRARARPPGRVDAPLRREVRRPAPAPGPPVRDPALQHAGRHGPRAQAAVVRGPRDHLRERRGEGQGDPRGLHPRDPRARRPVQRKRPGGSSRRASTPWSSTRPTATCCRSS